MNTYISMLRGINVGGHRKIPMEALRLVYERLGLINVRSYVQSGNIIFDYAQNDAPGLTDRIEVAVQQAYGYHVTVFMRQGEEFGQILASNPFINDRKENPGMLHVVFLYHTLPDTAWSKVIAPAGIADDFIPGNSVIYLYCPRGYGRSKLTNSFFERRLGMPVTTRNWNTVNALYKMVEGKKNEDLKNTTKDLKNTTKDSKDTKEFK